MLQNFFCFTIILLLFSCTPAMRLQVQQIKTKPSETGPQIMFHFYNSKGNGKRSLWRVEVYKNDSLILKIENQYAENDTVYSWHFPELPNGFKIIHPENAQSIPVFAKNDKLRFEFLAGGAYSTWVYEPK